jgi:hypothetical protein
MQHDTDLVARVPIAAVAMINRPTIPLAEYNSLKAMYDHAPAAERQRARQGLAALGAQQTPIVQGINFAGAQEGGPLGRAALGKRNREVSQANHVMASVELVADEPASDSDRIQQEVGDQAEQVQSSRDQPEDDPVFDTEMEPRLPVRPCWLICRQMALVPQFDP